jgi:uncharacterized protein YutE (UPF0331/DUF86 family)
VTPVDAAIVRRKLAHIITALEALGPIEGYSLDEYRSRLYERKAAERFLQEAIEAALDINAHLIAEVGSEVPDDYYGGFIELADLGIVETQLARDLAPSAGLRNRLVHEYDAIDDARVLQAIGTMRRQYPRYVQAIEHFLARAGH